jgi:UDP-N-acetylmuramoyl-L-alanyl-D-glutamate--2,6-diaminopimelate ligase
MSDFSITTSDTPRLESQNNIFEDMRAGVADDKKIVFISNRRETIKYAIRMSQTTDIILVAGKGYETYQLIDGQTFGFNDKKVIAETAKLYL